MKQYLIKEAFVTITVRNIPVELPDTLIGEFEEELQDALTQELERILKTKFHENKKGYIAEIDVDYYSLD